MKILLSGATGFVGQYLTKELLKNDHQLYALVKKTSDTRLDPSIVQLTLPLLQTLDEQIDVFINLAGENIAARPWTAKRKEALFQSRVTLTKQVRMLLLSILTNASYPCQLLDFMVFLDMARLLKKPCQNKGLPMVLVVLGKKRQMSLLMTEPKR
ncbi:NAD-dependent epimerase/dehydratase family protein [Marinomonas rhodophyticola]|uniref:NAD-dependent epimerase/dehydratase family protein n=1 Tax=Marinomonas rhodophyticola TaxID=2992803 RepID=A0ABT3KN89_9GAMM|nr:NAD-dependent epimerase/dehydratase family protein [Marinomonas sp. KJ51-3]MCW4631834.1 NAD-dependent epimerase/dehydratase family protein [Marinomonas sp. KJ51-3]